MITYDEGTEAGRYGYHFDALGSVVALSKFDNTSASALNRYTYVANNPLKFTDPSGHGSGNYKESRRDERLLAVGVSLR